MNFSNIKLDSSQIPLERITTEELYSFSESNISISDDGNLLGGDIRSILSDKNFEEEWKKKQFFASTFKLREEHLNDFSVLESEEIERWKLNEIENFNSIHSLKKQIKKITKDCLFNLLKVDSFKDNLILLLNKPLNVSNLDKLVFLSSFLFLSFSKLNDFIYELNKVLFIDNDGENYNFLPFRLLMRQFVGLERVIEGYEEKLQFTLSEIGELTPKLKSLRKKRDLLEIKLDKLLVHNGNLEKSISKMSKNISEGFVEKGKDMIKEFKQNQELTIQKIKEINNFVETRITGMGSVIEKFEKEIGNILLHPSNFLNEKSQTSLYSMQIHVMHLGKRFQNLHRTVIEKSSKLKKSIKKKISGTQVKIREIRERKGYNLKMKFARKHLEKLEKKVLPELKVLGDILNKEEITKMEKKKSANLMKNQIKVLENVYSIALKILTPIIPKVSMIKQLKALKSIPDMTEIDGEIIEELNQVMFRKKKKKNKNTSGDKDSKKKSKKVGKKQTKAKVTIPKVSEIQEEMEESGYIPRKKHVKITSELYTKMKKMERLYEKKIREVKSRIEQYEREEKRKQNKKIVEKFRELRAKSGRIKGRSPNVSLVRPQTSSSTNDDNNSGIEIPDVEIKTVPVKSLSFAIPEISISKESTKDTRKIEKDKKKEDVDKKKLDNSPAGKILKEKPKSYAWSPSDYLKQTREDMIRMKNSPINADVIDLDKEGWMEEVIDTAGIEKVPNKVEIFDLEKYYAEDEVYDGDIPTIEEEGEEEGEFYSDDGDEEEGEFYETEEEEGQYYSGSGEEDGEYYYRD